MKATHTHTGSQAQSETNGNRQSKRTKQQKSAVPQLRETTKKITLKAFRLAYKSSKVKTV
jgi:hypothetical protein